MKTLIVILLVMFTIATANAQIDILGKVEEKIEQKIDEETDKEIDKAIEGEKKEKETEAATTATSGARQAEPSFKSYSKFDFVPGDKVIFYENFSQDAIGDFPANWNTNGSGEVVTLSNVDGRWLKWNAGVTYAPNLNIEFPDNFTLEFDMLMQKPEERYEPYYSLSIYASESDNLNDDVLTGTTMTTPNIWTVSNANNGEYQDVGTSQAINNSTLYGRITHFSIWGQKQRMRVYVNQTKVFDLPRAFPQGAKLNRIKFTNNPGLNLSDEDAGPIFLTNVRIAVGAPDMRSKLMTEGKLVTHGILFDVNSDKIKAESYGTLKEIAKVLTENASVRVKIVGHTDSDGEDNKNLELSKKRSAAVKDALVKEFAIDAARMETDGKGESQPAAPNTTAEGKANNRRVEFVKLP